MKYRFFLPGVLLAPLALGEVGALPVPAPAELNDGLYGSRAWGLEASQQQGELKAELQETVAQYHRTGNARYVSPVFHLTPLHLAVLAMQPELVEKLLAEGADPNARLRRYHMERVFEDGRHGVDKRVYTPRDTPLLLALGKRGAHRADLHRIVELLLAAGADPNIRSEEDKGVLSLCALWREGDDWRAWEGLALFLMEKGARGNVHDATWFTRYGYERALSSLLESPDGAPLRQQASPMLERAADALGAGNDTFGRNARILACVRLILSQPASIDEPCGQMDNTPLAEACRLLELRSTPEPNPAHAEFITLMLEHGADPQRRPQGEYREDEPTPADHLATCPSLRAELTRRGFRVEPPLHRFEHESIVDVLLHLPPAAVRDEEVREQWGILANIFTGKEYPHEPLYPYEHAAQTALELLHRADANRTRQMLLALPEWRSRAAWKGEAARVTAFLQAILSTELLVLPADWLHQTALVARRAGKQDAAHSLLCLMGRDPGPQAARLIEQLCATKGDRFLSAAAWSARLRREGLPDLLGKDAATWFRSGHAPGTAMPECLITAHAAQQAVRALVTEHHHLGCDCQNPVSPAETLTALRTLGAHKAATLCEQEGPHSPQEKEAARQELEAAYSQHLWQHRDEMKAKHAGVKQGNEGAEGNHPEG